MSLQPSVCLLMLIRDEAVILDRCLLSVRAYIDNWLIVDTGSKDDSVNKVKTVLEDIPGELVHLPWTDFATIRNELQQLSRGRADYILWLDADETITSSSHQPWIDLHEQAYSIEVKTSRGSYLQCRLIRDDNDYCYTGNIVETITTPELTPVLDSISVTHHEDGVRWRDPAKNQRDILAFKSALLDTPKDPLLTLALADSYAAQGELVEALHYYQIRASLKGHEAQVWYALYQAARMQDELGFGIEKVIQAYYQAYDYRPEKIEPLIRIARHCRRAQKLDTGLNIIKTALETVDIDREYYFEPDAWEKVRFLEYLHINLELNHFSVVINASEFLLSNEKSVLSLGTQKQIEELRIQALHMRSAHPELEDTVVNKQAGQQNAVQPIQHYHEPSPIPEQTPRKDKRKLCIGMCTYDDYDGVYFSVQAIRMYHPEILDQIEIMVIDNNPTAPAAKCLKLLDSYIDIYRYIPKSEAVGTTIRDDIFHKSNADYVLVMDCHVFIVPGALKRLIEYFDANPETNDILQGPLLSDDLKSISTHFKTGWQSGMWGTWATDPRGEEIDAEPFDIDMQGCGLFACRREAWPGFNPRFRGFGGEEGYIQEKVRQAGGRSLCLPFLRWMHRFNRPLGIPYPVDWADRIRNYMIGWHELNMDTSQIKAHFTELLHEQEVQSVFEQIDQEINSPLFLIDGIYCYQQAAKVSEYLTDTATHFEQLKISKRIIQLKFLDEIAEPLSHKLLAYRSIILNASESGLKHIFIIERPEDVANCLNQSIQESIQSLSSGKLDYLTITTESDTKTVEKPIAIAIHQKLFDSLLAEIPEDAKSALNWLQEKNSLGSFLQTEFQRQQRRT